LVGVLLGASVMSRKGELNSLTTEDRRWLEEGLALFRANYRGDGGRIGMLHTLLGVLNYLIRILPARDVELLKPLLHLERALDDLDRTGNKAPCFEGRKILAKLREIPSLR
jgi:hypothetical protein